MIEMNILQRQRRSFNCLLEASDNSVLIDNKMLTVRAGVSLTLTCSWDSSPPTRLSSTTAIWALFLSLFYLVLPCLAVIFWVPALFWKGNGGRGDSGGKRWCWGRTGVGRGKIVVVIYCMKEKNLFSLEKQKETERKWYSPSFFKIILPKG